MRKGIVAVSTLLVAVGTVTACGQTSSNSSSKAGGSGNNTSGGAGKTYVLKVSTVLQPSNPIYKGLVKFKDAVKKDTNGHVKVEIFPGGQLGADKDVLGQVKAGANEAVVEDAGRLAQYEPQMGILEAPYIVSSYQQANKLVSPSLWKGWESQLAQKSNIRVLSFNWYQGEREFLTNKPIKTPADLHGLKIRTMGTTVALDTIRDMGASPVGMAWTSVYPALQQHTIDGAEAQLSAVYGAKLYEVIKYVTFTRHFQLLTGVVTSNKWYNSLPSTYQKILTKDASAAGEYASKLTIQSSKSYEKKMKAKGVIFEKVNLAPFKKKADKVYTQIKGYQKLKQQVDNILNSSN